MSRREFSVATREAAWERSGGACEAEGAAYGLGPQVRCGADMTMARVGVHYDHINPDALSKDNSLENCAAVCRRCHDFKTRNRDMPMITDSTRLLKKARGQRHLSRPLPGTKRSGIRKPMNGSVGRW